MVIWQAGVAAFLVKKIARPAIEAQGCTGMTYDEAVDIEFLIRHMGKRAYFQ
jgi:hypothetical protein